VVFEQRPGATIDDRSFAIEMRSFASQAERLEQMRRERDRDKHENENRLPTPDAIG
jgi:hypothetical protein